MGVGYKYKGVSGVLRRNVCLSCNEAQMMKRRVSGKTELILRRLGYNHQKVEGISDCTPVKGFVYATSIRSDKGRIGRVFFTQAIKCDKGRGRNA